jgi:phosphoglycerate dehydrogenase-like enzyme
VRYSCAVIDDYQAVAAAMADWTRISHSVDVRFLHDHEEGVDQLAERLGAFDIIVVMRERTPFGKELLERLNRLRLLVTTGHRNASIDLRAASDLGLTVCGTYGLDSPTVELTWALILAHARRLPLETSQFRRGGPWQNSIGVDLANKRLGIIGLGRLGQRVARVAQAFDMTVAAWSQNLTEARCLSLNVEHAGSLHELLSTSDFVTVHLVLSDRTHGLIGQPELRAMKPSAMLVNTSRAPIVDEEALIEALREQTIAGAALDVFDREPLPPQHPFRTLENLVATPHLGYVTEDNYRMHYGMVVENIEAWLAGAPLRLVQERPPRAV